MRNPTLTETDRSVLAELAGGSDDAAALAEEVGVSPTDLADRLAFMADNGLLREEGDRLELTDDGRRVLRAPSDGSADDLIDAPEEVVWTLQERGLRAERLDAVLSAYAFLRYWGAATAAEIADGAFSEAPLTYETADEWWTDFAREHLGSLPDVEEPETEDGLWRFSGTPDVADHEDGRRVLLGDDAGRSKPYASASEAIDDAGLADGERIALAAALRRLQREGEADDATLRETAAGIRAADPPDDDWLDEPLSDALSRLPGVVRADGRWRYTLGPDGYEREGEE